MHIVHDSNTQAADLITFAEFARVDIRIGTVRECLPFPQARNPSYILLIDFGPAVGVRKSVAQITQRYLPKDLVGAQVIGVVNFPPRQIGPMRSEVLVLGFADHDGSVTLATAGDSVPNGARLS